MFRFININNIFEITSFVTLFETELDHSKDFGEECYNFPRLIYVKSGECFVAVNHQPCYLKEGCLLIVPANAVSRVLTKGLIGKCSIYVVSFLCNSEALKVITERCIFLNSSNRALLEGIILRGGDLFRWYGSVCSSNGMYLADETKTKELFELKLKAEMLLYNLYIEITDGGKGTGRKNYIEQGELITEVIEYLKENLNRQIIVFELAKTFYTGVSTLKKKFKDKTGMGVIEYFIDLKLRKGAEMLEKGNYSVSEVSEWLGFSSPGYFSRLFKQKLGLSPSEYRKKTDRKDL